ncbi:MAG: hypothetical protein JWP73_855, partial [Phenylobacterium sp.]|nr:hypothetical protein [Phenylobacterium sp.]
MAPWQAALALSAFWRRHMKASRPCWPAQSFCRSAPQAWVTAARAAYISGEPPWPAGAWPGCPAGAPPNVAAGPA